MSMDLDIKLSKNIKSKAFMKGTLASEPSNMPKTMDGFL